MILVFFNIIQHKFSYYKILKALKEFKIQNKMYLFFLIYTLLKDIYTKILFH